MKGTLLFLVSSMLALCHLLGQISLPIGNETVVREYSATNTTDMTIQTIQIDELGDEFVIVQDSSFSELYTSYDHLISVAKNKIINAIEITKNSRWYDPNQQIKIYYKGARGGTIAKFGNYSTFIQFSTTDGSTNFVSNWQPQIYDWASFEFDARIEWAEVLVTDRVTGRNVPDSSGDSRGTPAYSGPVWLSGKTSTPDRILHLKRDICTRGGVGGDWNVRISVKLVGKPLRIYDGSGQQASPTLSLVSGDYPTLRVVGPEGLEVTVHSSTNLVSWEPWKIVTLGDQELSILDDRAPAPFLFYRIR